jgi:hypothetical protein
MVGWGDSLSEEELRAVTRYEREVLSGEVVEGAAGAEGGDAGEGEAAAAE